MINNHEQIKRWSDFAVLPLVLVASALPLLWFGRNWGVPHDGSWYLLQGWNLISGAGYTIFGEPQVLRGPILPGTIGGLMLLFGRDLEDLAWAVRLIAFVNPLLVYFLIKRVAGPVSGLLAAVLTAFFGYTAISWHAFNIDALQLSVYLLSLLAVLTGVRKNNLGVSLLSGVLLGVAILCKETSLALLPVGLFTTLRLGWNVRCMLLHYAGAILICLPWWVWVWKASGEIYLLGRISPLLIVLALVGVASVGFLGFVLYSSGTLARLLTSERRGWIGWILILVYTVFFSVALLSVNLDGAAGVFASTEDYITQQLLVEIRLWHLLPFAAAYALWKSISGHDLWNFYFAVLVLQVPVSLLVLLLQWGTRQWLLPQTLLYGALAALIVGLCRSALRGGWLRFVRFAPVALGLLVAVALSFGPQVHYFRAYNIAMASFPPNNANGYVMEMHEWIQNNVPLEEGIVTSSLYSEQLTFLDASRHTWNRFEASCVDKLSPCAPNTTVLGSPPAEVAWFEMSKDCKHSLVSFDVLMSQMEASRSEYVLVDETLPWAAYLGRTAAFDEKFESHGGASALTLFRRTGQKAMPATTWMQPDSFTHLIRCERHLVDNEAESVVRSHFRNGIQIVGEGEDAKSAQLTADSMYSSTPVAQFER